MVRTDVRAPCRCFSARVALTPFPVQPAVTLHRAGTSDAARAHTSTSEIFLVLLLERAFRVLEIRWPTLVEPLPYYLVGMLGAFWTIQRVAIVLRGFA